MSEPAINHIRVEFSPPYDIDQEARAVDALTLFMKQVGIDVDTPRPVYFTGLENNPTAEARLMAALEAEAAAIEAERKAAPPSAPQIKKPRRPRFDRARAIAQAEKATGRPAQTITLPDGTKVDFGKVEPIEPENPWLADLRKETKQ